MHKDDPVSITMSVEDWANVMAGIGTSRLELFLKDRLNETIYNCVTRPPSDQA